MAHYLSGRLVDVELQKPSGTCCQPGLFGMLASISGGTARSLLRGELDLVLLP
jgi:hypothetical protein